MGFKFSRLDSPILTLRDLYKSGAAEFDALGRRIIRSPQDLELMRATPGGSYALYGDVALTQAWTPIPNFTGSLDGQGFSILGLWGQTGAQAGLFTGLLGTVRRLHVEANLTSGGEPLYDAAIAATMSGGLIEDVRVTGTLGVNDRAGGVVGYMTGGILNRVVSEMLVPTSSASRRGSVIGFYDKGTITQAYSVTTSGPMGGGNYNVDESQYRTTSFLNLGANWNHVNGQRPLLKRVT